MCRWLLRLPTLWLKHGVGPLWTLVLASVGLPLWVLELLLMIPLVLILQLVDRLQRLAVWPHPGLVALRIVDLRLHQLTMER
jgi:hypothetical protein